MKQNRIKVENKSHLTEMMQKTRLEYENGDISMEEIDGAIRVSCLMTGFEVAWLFCNIGAQVGILHFHFFCCFFL
jgi:hypothetical protein